MFYRNNIPYMCDGLDPFQKQMSKQERHFSSTEFTWRYHPLSFIQNSVKYAEFCRVGKKSYTFTTWLLWPYMIILSLLDPIALLAMQEDQLT